MIINYFTVLKNRYFKLLYIIFLQASVIGCEFTSIQVFHGSKIQPYVPGLTLLGSEVFREYPYLEEGGTLEESMPFFQYYAQSEHGMACILFHQNTIIGAILGLPLNETWNHFQQPFLKMQDFNIDSYFYIGELMLLKTYRGRGHGKDLYFALEQEIQKQQKFSGICLAKIIEVDYIVEKPSGYRPIDQFWQKLGFTEYKELQFSDDWRFVGEPKKSEHQMVYWIKNLN